MKIESFKDFHLNENLIFRKTSDIMMVYNKDSGDMYEFNDVGSDIISLLREDISIVQLPNRLTEIYDVDVEVMEEDVVLFLERLIDLGVLVV